MSDALPKVNIGVADRILLHLLHQDFQADRYMVNASLTRPGIADACGMHPPNVSRTMKDLHRDGLVSEHTRAIQGDERRQKTWQLTDAGRHEANARIKELKETKVLIREVEGDLVEVQAGDAATFLATDLPVLQILLHAQHEGVLVYGDIRFGQIQKTVDGKELPKPGRLVTLVGAHATYANKPPETRPVYGRDDEVVQLQEWFDERKPCVVVHGIAGIGKSTFVAHWLKKQIEVEPHLSICWYPCQPWDRSLGLATSLLHRFGIDETHDPYHLIETLPLQPRGEVDVDSWRRRLLAYLTDANTIRERFKETAGGPPPYWLVVIDDIHHITESAGNLLGSLIEISKKAPLRLMFISRTTLNIYDRRDVHTRDIVRELPLTGLTVDAIRDWLVTMKAVEVSEEEIHTATGGHPLALELLELYGQPTHVDWLRFLDEEILSNLPAAEAELLHTLATATEPVPWEKLSSSLDWQGPPPPNLLKHGLLLELSEGMWLHEALRERLNRDVGKSLEQRKARLNLD
ncbi:MAG: AAA family ATPase [archaeon]|nr:AAA family ATPase [archaeon]